MVSLFSLSGHSRILDPCFGHGVFVESLLVNTGFIVDGVEIDRASFLHFANPNSKRCTLRHEDFFDIEKHYDGIIMNPPYVRHEEIDALAPLGVTKKKLQAVCNQGKMSVSGRANLYIYFILKAVTLLRDEGELIAIFPNTWVNTPVGRQFQEQLHHNGSITDFIEIKGNPFEGSPIVDVCILKFVKGLHKTPAYKHLYIDGDTLSVKGNRKPKTKHSKGLVQLKSIATIRRGITTGANRIFVNPPLISQCHLAGIVSSPRNINGYSTKHCKTDKLLALSKTCRLNNEERDYLQNCAAEIVKQGRPKALKRMIERNDTWYLIPVPDAAQIVFPYIVRKNIRFILNDGKRNVRDNFYMITSKHNPLLLFALLNNYHVYAQLERCGKTYGSGVLKIQKYDLDDIVIPAIESINQDDQSLLVSMAQELIATSDTTAIDRISDLLYPYFGTRNVRKQYDNLKNKRLNGYGK